MDTQTILITYLQRGNLYCSDERLSCLLSLMIEMVMNHEPSELDELTLCNFSDADALMYIMLSNSRLLYNYSIGAVTDAISYVMVDSEMILH